MPPHASSLESLFSRQSELVRELHTVTAKLQKLSHLVVSKKGASAAANGSAAKRNGVSKRRSWFERGEAVGLLKKLAKKPMHQADLVRALSSAKGYDKGLSAADAKRFQSAAYQAIANAVAGKKLIAIKDGTVRARA
jgi:hypothetical protein